MRVSLGSSRHCNGWGFTAARVSGAFSCRRSIDLPTRISSRDCVQRNGAPVWSRECSAARPRRHSFDIRVELTAKGKRYLARDISVKRIMGEGSFGQVFEGVLAGASGQDRIVLKRVKTRVRGAEEMGQMEHLLNVYGSKVAGNCIADFMGYCGVSGEEANGRLTQGLWLLWKYEGDKTLADYLRRRDCMESLAQDLGVPESAVAPTVLKNILECLQGLHAAGLVHRDVKPSNIIFVEEARRFKFIDLGACADLRSGTNYVPDESILDPNYCPPEQYVLPTDAPHLSQNMLAMAISPMLWAKHKPDRFDIYSAGLIFLQLAVPTLQSDRGLKAFTSKFHQYDYDLGRWRKGANLLSRHTTVLDAGEEAGWKLAEAMLRPRRIEQDDTGGVKFIEDGSDPRISASEALKHRFMKMAHVPGRGSTSSMWKTFARKLLDLENRILKQAVEAEEQTTTVKKLKGKVAIGKAPKSDLEAAEKSLAKMEKNLGNLTQEFEATSKQAFNFFGVFNKVGSTIQDALSGTTSDKAAASASGNGSEPGRDASSKKSGFSWWGRPSAKTTGKDAVETPQTSGNGAKPADGKKAPNTLGTGESLVYFGLRFTGLATKIAGDLAKSVKEDAEKMLVEMEEGRATKKAQKDLELQYMEMLKSAEPRITGRTSWSEAQEWMSGDARFKAIAGSRRQALFEAYIFAVKGKEGKARAQAEGDLRILFEGMYVDGMQWAEMAKKCELDTRFQAVTDPETRRMIYDQAAKSKREKLAAQTESKETEADFRKMLKELEPPITSSSTWAKVKREIFPDARYQAVPEKRGLELFLEYHSIVCDIEREDKATHQKEEAIEELEREADVAASRLEQLKSEQSQLKEEYQKMERKLKEMEMKLDTKESRLPPSKGRKKKAPRQVTGEETVVTTDKDGNLVFKFGDKMTRMSRNGGKP